MLSWEVIESCLGEWASGVVVANKPGPGDAYRFCVDLVDVNNVTKKVKFPIPFLEEVIENLGERSFS